MFENIKDKDELNIIIKSDVQGSSEALKMAINNIKHAEVEAKIILSDIGMINETDVSLAKASKAILIGFNVKPLFWQQSVLERPEHTSAPHLCPGRGFAQTNR